MRESIPAPSTSKSSKSVSTPTLKSTWLLPLTLASLVILVTGVQAAPSYDNDLRVRGYEPRPRPWESERKSTDSDAPVNVGVEVERRTPASINIPLVRRPSPKYLPQEEHGPWAKRHAEWLVAKYSESNDESDQSQQRRSSGSTYLSNQNTDSTFYASIGIGTPPTVYNVIVDTGSSDLWVAGRDCIEGCSGAPLFDGSNSSTFQDLGTPFSVTYGSASARGTLAKDSVQMGGYEVQGQTFAIVDAVTSGLLNSPVSGLIGLAFSGIAASRSTPFWLQLASSGSWDSPLMSFVLTRFLGVPEATTLEPGGVLTFGALNHSLYTGEIDFVSVPTSTRNYWQLPLTSLTVQGNDIELAEGSESYAAIDTGTTLIGAPEFVIDRIISLVPNSTQGEEEFRNYIYYPCDTRVTITFSFGSRVWVIEPDDFELLRVRNGLCVSAFFKLSSSGSTPRWIIGDTFLKNVYSVFQYSPPAVGFADLSEVSLAMSNASNPLPSPSLGATVVIMSTGMSSLRISSSFLSTLSSIFSSILSFTLSPALPFTSLSSLGLNASHGIHSILIVLIISSLVYSL